MLCPKCGANIPDDSKFCVFCGNKIEKIEPVKMMNEAADQSKETLCPGCGAVMRPGAKFCTKCGMRQEAEPVPPVPPTPPIQPTPVPPVPPTPPVQPTPVLPVPPTPPVQPTPVPPVPPTPPVQPTPVPPVPPTPPIHLQPAQPILQPKPKKKSAVGIVIIVILLLAVIAGAGYYFFFLQDDGSAGNNPETSESDTREGEDEESEESDSSDALEESGSAESSEEKKGDVTLLEPAKALADQAKTQYDNGVYVDGSIPLCKDAMEEYIKVAEENNLKEEAQEGIDNVYWVYVDSMIRYCDSIKSQGAYAAGLEQIYSMLKAATDLTTSLTEKGYTVDSQELMTYSANIIQVFRDMYIESINNITKYENWSRDEAWNYADQAYSVKENGKPILFDEQELEDPLRMRYVYCLAWVTRKRCETGLRDGSMSNADAANNMVAILAETDYNLLLLQDIITYGSAAQMDVEKYRNAYNAIVDKIKQEQNFTVMGSDTNVRSTTSVDVNHFWYFNDLSGEDKYKVDMHNGTTAATREWIRSNVPGMLQ